MSRAELAALLRNLTVDMTMRHGASCQALAYAHASNVGTFDGKTAEYWQRARRRQFKAIQRLTLAQLRLTKGA